MSSAFNSDTTNLMSRALQQALDRLRMLGLVMGDDESEASAVLSRLILEAADHGERNEENLILFALGRFSVTVHGTPAPGQFVQAVASEKRHP
jgi:hypothetical protein